jgi:hypothetical protein
LINNNNQVESASNNQLKTNWKITDYVNNIDNERKESKKFLKTRWNFDPNLLDCDIFLKNDIIFEKYIDELSQNYKVIYKTTVFLGTCEYKYYQVGNHHIIGGIEVEEKIIDEYVYPERKGKKHANRIKLKKKCYSTIMNDFHIFTNENDILYSLSKGVLLGLCRTNRPMFYDVEFDILIRQKDYHHFRNKVNRKIVMNNKDYYVVVPESNKKFNGKHENWFQIVDEKKLCHIDLWMCERRECTKDGKVLNMYIPPNKNDPDPRKRRGVNFRRGITKCDKRDIDSEESICAWSWGGKTYLSEYGPYNWHTKEDFPEIEFCGIKSRIHRDFLVNRNKFCLDWMYYVYGPMGYIKINFPDMWVKREAKGISRYNRIKNFLRYKGVDEIYKCNNKTRLF